MSKQHWLVIGKDERMKSCAETIQAEYGDCTVCRTDEVTDELIDLVEQVNPTHIVLPVQGLGGSLPGGLFRKGSRFFAGLLKEGQLQFFEQEGHTVQRYLTDERFVWNNARLTAEAFVKEFFTETKQPIAGTPIGIAGFGRVGRITSYVLGGLGAELTVYARSEAQLGEAEALGFTAKSLRSEELPGSGFLVNTIPAQWLNRNGGSTLHVFELASMPGCLEPGSSSAYYTIHLGLPGKHFPNKAGEFLGRTILRMCRGKE